MSRSSYTGLPGLGFHKKVLCESDLAMFVIVILAVRIRGIWVSPVNSESEHTWHVQVLEYAYRFQVGSPGNPPTHSLTRLGFSMQVLLLLLVVFMTPLYQRTSSFGPVPPNHEDRHVRTPTPAEYFSPTVYPRFRNETERLERKFAFLDKAPREKVCVPRQRT
jgi:hypothetical protein